MEHSVLPTLRKDDWTHSAVPCAPVTLILISGKLQNKYAGGPVGERWASEARCSPMVVDATLREGKSLTTAAAAAAASSRHPLWQVPIWSFGAAKSGSFKWSRAIDHQRKTWGEKGSESFFYPLTKVLGFLLVTTKLP